MNVRLSPVSILVFVLVLLALLYVLQRSSPGPDQSTTHSRQHHRSERSYDPRYPENEGGSRERASRRSRQDGLEGGASHEPGEVNRDASCQELGVTCASRYFSNWQQPEPGSCVTEAHNGYPVPDSRCTPGGIDTTVTAETLRNPEWRTRCIRNCETSEAEKHVTYGWYGIVKPRGNSGENQVCELDHLVPLELGGADGFGNIWPECGPAAASLDERYFKIKDKVENYLAEEVRAGRMPLETAQRGIATDWTRYLVEADRYCSAGGHC